MRKVWIMAAALAGPAAAQEAVSVGLCRTEPDLISAALICEVTNHTDVAIAQLLFSAEARQAGRTVPWAMAGEDGSRKLAMWVPGGIEPGETAPVRFSVPNLPPEADPSLVPWKLSILEAADVRGHLIWITAVEPPFEETAREEAADQLVVEGEEPATAAAEPASETALAVAGAPRPPARPGPTAEEVGEAGTDITTADTAAADLDPPWTNSERDAFRLGVQACWIVDPGAQAARVTVTVTFELGRDGRVAGDITLLTSSGGDGGIVEAAFDSARRAILRCQGAEGFPLPDDKYEQWRFAEMTFDPEGISIR